MSGDRGGNVIGNTASDMVGSAESPCREPLISGRTASLAHGSSVDDPIPTPLLILGAGGHAQSVADAAIAAGLWSAVAFLDDAKIGQTVLGFPVLGGLAMAQCLVSNYPDVFVALGNNALRLQWLETLRGWGFLLPTIVHPAAVVSPSATLGEGCVLMAGAIVNVLAEIGRGCILNTACTVDHNCVIGDGVHLSPGAHIGGDTFVGPRTWVCIGAAVGSQRSICGDCVVAAGATVVRDIAEPGLYAGAPAVKKR